jgi:predicted TPR repeat methyltransferase
VATSLFHSSGDLTADRRYTFARDLAARGDMAGAADLLTQTVELTPSFAAAWFALGQARAALGQQADAIAAFRKALAADPQDRHGANLHLIRLGAEPIGNMPPPYVREVFDQYAGRFDEALTQGLAYRAPALLLAAVQKARDTAGLPRQLGSLLDLGCGTGLGGAAFRPFCDPLTGIDISANMVAQAEAKGFYDRLIVGDIVEFLTAGKASMHFQFILAADVFAYFADLHELIAACAAVLAPKGALAFTVETHAGDGVILGEKLRYAHSAKHVRSTLTAAGLNLVSIDEASTRNEGGVPVPGLVVVAERDR